MSSLFEVLDSWLQGQADDARIDIEELCTALQFDEHTPAKLSVKSVDVDTCFAAIIDNLIRDARIAKEVQPDGLQHNWPLNSLKFLVFCYGRIQSSEAAGSQREEFSLSLTALLHYSKAHGIFKLDDRRVSNLHWFCVHLRMFFGYLESCEQTTASIELSADVAFVSDLLRNDTFLSNIAKIYAKALSSFSGPSRWDELTVKRLIAPDKMRVHYVELISISATVVGLNGFVCLDGVALNATILKEVQKSKPHVFPIFVATLVIHVTFQFVVRATVGQGDLNFSSPLALNSSSRATAVQLNQLALADKIKRQLSFRPGADCASADADHGDYYVDEAGRTLERLLFGGRIIWRRMQSVAAWLDKRLVQWAEAAFERLTSPSFELSDGELFSDEQRAHLASLGLGEKPADLLLGTAGVDWEHIWVDPHAALC